MRHFGLVCLFGLVPPTFLLREVVRVSGCVAVGGFGWMDVSEVHLCDPCACVRPCVPCVSRLPPVSFYDTGYPVLSSPRVDAALS